MSDLQEAEVRALVRRIIDSDGVGIVWNGQVRFTHSPCAEFCNQYRDKHGVDKCAEFYRELDESGRVETRECPAGFQISYASLSPSTKEICGVSIHSACGPSAGAAKLPIGVNHFSRRLKKSAIRFLANLGQWKNPRSDTLIESLGRLQIAAEEQRVANEDRTFNQTLTQYKDFVASFSHEALSPIQEVRVLLERAVKKMVDSDGKALLSQGIQALDKIRTSLEGMRLLFNPGQRPIPNQFQWIDLRSIVNTWCEIYREEISNKNILVVMEPSGLRWDVSAIKEYIEVLVRNLVSNAVKYSFDASGRSEPGKIVFRFQSGRWGSRFSVVNFGVPIPAAEIADRSIFQISRRARTANDRGRKGQGVGLYLVELIAQQHGGNVHVRSEPMNPGSNNVYARNEFSVTFTERH